MKSLDIAIIGAGNFGGALLRLFARYGSGHRTRVFDKLPDSDAIADVEALCEFDVIIPAVPIDKFESVIRHILPHIQSGCTIVDVCTIKEHSAAVLEKLLPAEVNYIATHPLFGPESLAGNQWNLSGLKLMYWPCRVDDAVSEKIVEILRATGLSVIEMTPAVHDETLARSQFLSLLVGALLVKMDIKSTAMNTRSFDELLDVKATTRHDFGILLDVFKYNGHCADVLDELQETLTEIVEALRANQNDIKK